MALPQSSEQTFFDYTLFSLLLASPLSFFSLQFLSAPYGKHNRPGWGLLLYPPLAWFLMESPTLWLSFILFPLGRNILCFKALVLYSPFVAHYFNRTLVYPFRLHLLNRGREGVFEVTDDRITAFEITADSETTTENTAVRNTAFEHTTDQQTTFENTALGKTSFRKTATGKTAFKETTVGNSDDRKTAFENTADRKTGFDDTLYRESASGKKGFENTADRETAFVNTADWDYFFEETNKRKTTAENTADGETAFDNTADAKTTFENATDRKTADGKAVSRGFDGLTHRKTAFDNTAVGETVDWKLDGLRIGDRNDQKTTNMKPTDQKTIVQKNSDGKTASGFPASIALMAFSYNIWNTYLQARWVSHYADFETDEWFWLRFGLGLAVFVTGMAVNIWADLVLLGLKRKDGKYRVPKGGLFEFVSCPNYFGEVVEWLGWALMTWSWVGVGFFFFTCSNLVPRAVSNHKWYLDKFGEDYPKNRKAVVPFLY